MQRLSLLSSRRSRSTLSRSQSNPSMPEASTALRSAWIGIERVGSTNKIEAPTMARSQTTPVSNLTLKLSAEDKKKLRNRMSGPVGSTSSSIKEETVSELAGLPELNVNVNVNVNAMAQKEAALA